ncbi:hypothetical protein ABZ383_00205 [Streptomyces sp. NPDC005900]|uniref:hypothetical protein n=1 Tax=Streptomyces sp. NPDC005900 TaxID=3154569 RepID=UPI0033C858B7
MEDLYDAAEESEDFGCDIAMPARFFDDDEELLTAGVTQEVFSRPEYVKAGARAEGIDLFDTEFFGYSPREATIMDPHTASS